MTLSLTLPLSTYKDNFYSYYSDIESFITTHDQDFSPNHRLVGYVEPSAVLPAKRYILALNFPVPLRPNSLIQATLKFNLKNNLPPATVSQSEWLSRFPGAVDNSIPITSVVEDLRNRELNRAVNNTVTIDMSTPGFTGVISTFHTIINNEATIRQNFFLNNQNIQNSLDITSFLSFHINTRSRSWAQNNNNIPLIMSGVSGRLVSEAMVPVSGGLGAIDLNTLTLDLSYRIVPPAKVSGLFGEESNHKQVTLGWQAPDNGGENIQKYAVSYASSGNTSLEWINVQDSFSPSSVVDNLPLNRSLFFRVAAVNSAGTGVFSDIFGPIVLSKNFIPISSLSFNEANPIRIRVRRDVSNSWNEKNPILALGEIAYESDSKRLKVGDGLSRWSGLSYVTIDQGSITFPTQPQSILRIASSNTNQPNNDRMTINLSNNDRLNIIGEAGIQVLYDNDFKKLTLRADALYNPIISGTIINPTSSGIAGTLLYDNTWLYFCTSPNYWQRTPVDKNWIDFSTMVISGNNDIYAGISSLFFNNNTGIFSTNADPYPALAGNPLTNTGTRRFPPGFKILESQNIRLNFVYRGGENTHNPMSITNTESILGFMFNGIPIKSCSLGSGNLIDLFPNIPIGFEYNFDSQNKMIVSSDNCGGYPNNNGLYSYRDGLFLKNCWNTPFVYNANHYYANSHYNNDHFRHIDGHSKILGFCLDGYPIYGPYGYSNALDKNSDAILMKSSFSGLLEDAHRPINWKYDNTINIGSTSYTLLRGMFIQDFVYVANLGHLDEFNGRFAVTPEFPEGTYAYYLTFTDDSLTNSAFPYIVGLRTKQQRYNNV